MVDLDRPYGLAGDVSLRPERFGALAYSFDTRRLSFLKHPDLVKVVEALETQPTVRDALVAVGVDQRRWPSFLTALTTLERSAMIRPRPQPQPSEQPPASEPPQDSGQSGRSGAPDAA